MHGLRGNLVLIGLAIIGAHALTYFLVGVLPDAAVITLGINSAQQEVLAAFNEAHMDRSYSEVLVGLVHLDLGRTLDGIPVTHALMDALSASAPRLILAFLIVLAASAISALLPTRVVEQEREGIATFLAFLPPYVLPFAGMVVLLSLTFSFGISTGDTLANSIAVVALATPPAALIFAQTRSISCRNLNNDFARTLLAVGATPLYQRYRLIHNVIAEIAPSLEKVFIGLISVLLFVEPIFGLSGFGTTAIRAIKRSDANLLLGITLVLALAVGIFRLLALFIRRRYGMAL